MTDERMGRPGRTGGTSFCARVRDEAHFDALLDRRFEDGGPVLLAARIGGEAGQEQTPRDPALIRNRLMKRLGTGRAGVLDA